MDVDLAKLNQAGTRTAKLNRSQDVSNEYQDLFCWNLDVMQAIQSIEQGTSA